MMKPVFFWVLLVCFLVGLVSCVSAVWVRPQSPATFNFFSGDILTWLDMGTYLQPNETFAKNVFINGYIQADDWSNVSINTSQIRDYVAGSENTTRSLVSEWGFANQTYVNAEVDQVTANISSQVTAANNSMYNFVTMEFKAGNTSDEIYMVCANGSFYEKQLIEAMIKGNLTIGMDNLTRVNESLSATISALSFASDASVGGNLTRITSNLSVTNASLYATLFSEISRTNNSVVDYLTINYYTQTWVNNRLAGLPNLSVDGIGSAGFVPHAYNSTANFTGYIVAANNSMIDYISQQAYATTTTLNAEIDQVTANLSVVNSSLFTTDMITRGRANSVGNFSADRGAFANWTRVLSLGNWSSERLLFANKTYVQSLGNWSNDQANYPLKTELDANITKVVNNISTTNSSTWTALGLKVETTNLTTSSNATINGLHIDKYNSTHWKIWG